MPCWEDGLTFMMHPNSTHLPIASYLPSTLVSSLPKENKKKKKKRKLSPWNCSVSQGATQYILLSTHLYLQILTTESLVWFEASGFYYTVNTGSSLGSSLTSPCHGDPAALICRTGPSTCSTHPIIAGVDAGVANVKQIYSEGINLQINKAKLKEIRHKKAGSPALARSTSSSEASFQVWESGRAALEEADGEYKILKLGVLWQTPEAAVSFSFRYATKYHVSNLL